MAKKKEKKFKILLTESMATSEDKEAKDFHSQSRFGEVKDNKVKYSLVEALYLLENKKVEVLVNGRKLSFDGFIKKATKFEPNFWVRYIVFKDMRDRGYIIKTALKFGADFRVYDRGVKPGQDHAKWILYPVKEAEVFSWYEFSAKNRVAHSTRKKLLIACVDEENDVTFWEVAWKKP